MFFRRKIRNNTRLFFALQIGLEEAPAGGRCEVPIADEHRVLLEMYIYSSHTGGAGHGIALDGFVLLCEQVLSPYPEAYITAYLYASTSVP